MPTDLVEWHVQHAAAQRQIRTCTFTCRRCGGAFEVKRWGFWRARRPGICPECVRTARVAATAAWRQRQRQARLAQQAARTCGQCADPLPAGRADAVYRSSRCRQKAYRQRPAP